LVSVIVPAYNAMPFLAETLESICAQTIEDLEVIVVDDGSTDSTAEYTQEFGRCDARVRCLSIANGGVARARDSGVAAAAGRYVSFLDSDDLWAPAKLERQLALIRNRTDVAALTGIRRFSVEAGVKRWGFDTLPPAGKPSAEHLHRLLFLRNTEMVGIASCLAPTSVWRTLGGYDSSLVTAEDWDMWFRVARKLELEVVPGEPLQYYRKRSGSLTTQSNLDRDFNAWRTILRKQHFLGRVSSVDARRAIAMKRLECAEMNRVRGHTVDCLRDLACSLADPSLFMRRAFHKTCVRIVFGG
jgi:glycosyltransferase involved in cell wall biosynthesis